MGIAVTPSFMKHHGYRTRDQPPARQAHRTGFGGVARCCRANAVRRCLPNKKPAAAFAAGFDQGRFHAFGEGCEAGVHLFDVAGGSACTAAGCCVVFDHSLLQESSAGRNLITLFSTVNNLSRLFFVVRRRAARCKRPSCFAPHVAPHACMHARPHADSPRASVGAVCSTCSHASMHSRAMRNDTPRTRTMQRIARADGGDAKAKEISLFALHKPDCAKLRELFRASRTIDARFCARRASKKNPRPSPRVRVLGRREPLSRLRLPATRRSRPGPAIR